MGAFDKCDTKDEVIQLLQEMEKAGTLNFDHEMGAELRLIELQTNQNILENQEGVTENVLNNDNNGEPSPSISVVSEFKNLYFYFSQSPK